VFGFVKCIIVKLFLPCLTDIEAYDEFFDFMLDQSCNIWIGMRFKGLDLNLLVVFDALMETHSVTRTAERLHLSQPAASAALRRLRAYFGDEILVAVGKRMHPTQFAEALYPAIRASLQGVERAIATPARFDPATSSRRFRIVTSDYVMVAVLVPLAERLARDAPGIQLEIRQPDESAISDLESGKTDMLISPAPYLAAWHPSELLFEERQVVVGWSGNPIFKSGVTREEFCRAGHVTISMGATRIPAFADSQLQNMGVDRNVEIVVTNFASAAWFLQGTNRLAVLHERLAHALLKQFDLAIAPVPFEFPVMQELVQYHEARAGDEGLSWLRRQIFNVANEHA
jgi:LysR family transcriptional regulator, nod-box dependent transcriptional activator